VQTAAVSIACWPVVMTSSRLAAWTASVETSKPGSKTLRVRCSSPSAPVHAFRYPPLRHGSRFGSRQTMGDVLRLTLPQRFTCGRRLTTPAVSAEGMIDLRGHRFLRPSDAVFHCDFRLARIAAAQRPIADVAIQAASRDSIHYESPSLGGIGFESGTCEGLFEYLQVPRSAKTLVQVERLHPISVFQSPFIRWTSPLTVTAGSHTSFFCAT